ncbi:hypothetical protein GCM10010912_06730 [Paenibacillus albidus]|uniref:Nudix hydrolase domain-containing protein n=1 Tax=Paenibacillus albidus TaxID=2041023 RepID=A0A917BZF5_9BACL|nr:hypothetical protein GCM10010912_06730 [Paenibacillus albidus]
MVREVKEETGYHVDKTHLIGEYRFTSETNDEIRMYSFTGEIIGGDLIYDGAEIMGGRWMSMDELAGLPDCRTLHCEIPLFCEESSMIISIRLLKSLGCSPVL